MRFVLTLAIALLLPALAHAQMPNWRANPTFGTVTLRAGFTPDPTVKVVNAGGSTENPVSGSGCVGYLHMAAPDVDLNFTAGSLPLTISVESDTDTALLIYTPDGRWVCDDDSGVGVNPSITFSSPRSGNYNIWVSTYSAMSDRPRARVTFSEIGHGRE